MLTVSALNHLNDARSLGTISRIKSMAAADLEDEIHISQEATRTLVTDITTLLSPFIPCASMRRFQDEMTRLVSTASDLCLVMMQSKAIFVTEWIGDDDRKKLAAFNRARMAPSQLDQFHATSDSLVKFVEAPALLKFGNADGDQFDTSIILSPSFVVLER